jgi:RHS repeat-associated protein
LDAAKDVESEVSANAWRLGIRIAGRVSTQFGYARRATEQGFTLARDRIASLTDPYNNTTTFTYDDAGRRTAVTTPRGTTSYSYDGEGRVTTTTDPLGGKSRTAYDAAGDVLSRTDPLGNKTLYEYDAVGRVTRMTDANGGAWSYGYCAAIGGGGGGAACPTCGGGAGGTFCDLTDPDGNTIHREFDVMGRVVATTDSLSHTATVLYDKAGRKSSETDANGNTTSYGYDEAGRLVSVTEASGAVTGYTYDGNGNKLTQKDANGHTWSFAYDALNRLTQETDPLGRKTVLTYDNLGNLATKTDAKGQLFKYTYNVRRLTKVTYPDGSADNFTYDALGRRTGASNVNASYVYTYDNLNRVTSVVNQANNQYGFAAIGYTYDAAGNRKSETTAAGTVRYAYDGKNRLTSITDPVFGTFRFAYDGMDRRTELDYPNGVETLYQYDRGYRMTSIATKDSSGNVADAWSYAYDAVGNRLSKTDMNGQTETYQYDSVYRLAKAGYPDGTSEAFTYDPAGNRLTRTSNSGGVDSYVYDAANELLSISGRAYTYDANGNVKSIHVPSYAATDTFAYDFNNRATDVIRFAGALPWPEEKNLYGPNGERVYVNNTAEGTFMSPVYDTSGNDVFDGQGTQPSAMRWYRVFGPGVDEPLAEWSRNNTLGNTYFSHDGLGSVTLVTDANGKVLYRQSYTPFGERTIEGFTYNSTATRFGFTGREHAVGPYMYYRARHYDASTGRFLEADTYEGTEASPPSLNRYSYAYNNPVRYTDPGGRSADGGSGYLPIDEAFIAIIGTLLILAFASVLVFRAAVALFEVLWPALVGLFLEFVADMIILMDVAADIYVGWAAADSAIVAAALARGSAVFYAWSTIVAVLTAEEIPEDAALAVVWTYKHCEDLSGPPEPPQRPDASVVVCAVVLWFLKALGL